MKGGALISQGAYGCVFDNLPKCSKKDNKKIGKVFDDVIIMSEELEQSKIISKIDPTQKYFIYGSESCTIDYKTLEKIEKDVHKCELPIKELGNNVPILKMPYGGVEIINYLLKNKCSYKEFLKIIINILNGIKLLNKNNLIHHDIKPNNILINKKAKLIDFGMTINCNNVYNFYENEYFP